MNSGDVIENIYDGMGVRVKEITTSGGTTTEKRFVNALGRVIQERDGSDAVTARYYWEGSRFFKKDYGASTKYFIPEINNSPLTVWNNAGTFNRYDLWDFFGVLEDQSAPGSASPFEKWANIQVDASHLTSSIKNAMQWPELGRLVNGFFSLTFFNGGIGGGAVVGGCGVLAELVGTTGGGGGILGGDGYGCGGGVGPPKLPQPPPDVPPCVKVNVCVPGGEEDAQYLESLGVVVCRECITIVVGGGGGGGGDCRCDSDNMAYIGGGVSAGESIRTSTGWIKEPCKCKLRVKAGATASEMNKPDSCCYYLDCGDAGKYDIYNSKVDAFRKGCLQQQLIEFCSQHSQGSLDCFGFCHCISSLGGGNVSSVPRCMIDCLNACGEGGDPLTPEGALNATTAVLKCLEEGLLNLFISFLFKHCLAAGIPEEVCNNLLKILKIWRLR